MKKLISALLLLMAATGVNAQLLWKISGNGLQKPSYIVGTYHLAPVSFADSIPGLNDALASTEQVYGEVIMADMTSPENMTKVQAAMMLPDGQTLDKLYTADEMARINALLKNILGADMTNPMIAQQLGRLTPQALQTQLGILMYLKTHTGFNPNETFDGYFQKEATAKNKAVGGLETIDFQINTLFKGMSTENVVKAFFAQDLEGIEKAMDAKMNNTCDGTPAEKDMLINNRNAEWIKQMPGIMKQKSTFFAVGAGHLPGDKGVLALLKKAGYTVESILF